MMPSPESGDDSFFNDLQRQPNSANNEDNENAQAQGSNNSDGKDGDGVPKMKRIACVLCRKRKLKCDGARPTCGTCRRLAHDCAYDEVRRKSGPKRGYVKALEARLQQVETLLKSQESTDTPREAAPAVNSSFTPGLPQNLQDPTNIQVDGGDPMHNMFPTGTMPTNDTFNIMPNNNLGEGAPGEEPFPWEMIGLGLDEPLPPPDVVNELNEIYFTKIHPSVPLIHRPRYYAAMNLAPHMRPPVCLRYIMWCLAAGVVDKYEALQEHFYHRARKYAQADEMRGHGESTITLAHCQAWTLLCTYEFKSMYFPRAWLSAGRAVRLAQMMQLHRLDGVGLDVKQCLPPPRDWTEREERRRTFWMAFCIDRYASIGTGWPMTIEEKDIMTNLPASEEAFNKSKQMSTHSLEHTMTPAGVGLMTSFGGVVIMAAMFGRNLTHLHRPTAEDRDDDLNGDFWKRHRMLDGILLNTSLGLPDHLRMPNALTDSNAVFMNMSIHTSIICLHQAAIFKADKHRLPITVSNESKVRCVTAAAEIANLMRMISHYDLSAMNPFIAFCIYVAARVFTQYMKTRPKDGQVRSSLEFLLQAMQALKRKNPLTESFLVQLEVDLESAGFPVSTKSAGFRNGKPPGAQSNECPSIFDVSDGQAQNQSTTDGVLGGNHLGAQQPLHETVSPGPPFHTARATINLDVNHSPYELKPSSSNFVENKFDQVREAARSKTMSRGIIIPLMDHSNESSEMDTSVDNNSVDQATPSSHPSSSHAFTPPTQDDIVNTHFPTSHPGLGGRKPSSPQSISNSSNHSSIHQRNLNNAATAAAQQHASPAFFPTAANDFGTINSQFYAADSSSGPAVSNDPVTGFVMPAEWDMAATASASGGGTGMTPLSENGWQQMLDGMAMNWDGMSPTAGGGSLTDGDVRRGAGDGITSVWK